MAEILAPAGNLTKLKTALLYGADAVYLAGQKYGLRSGADNFSLEQIQTAVSLAHQQNTKIYVTANAFLHNADFLGFKEFIGALAEIGVDAIIASDLGVVHWVLKHSSLPIHLSTQASVTNQWHAKFWQRLGVKRIVLGREASIQQAAMIRQTANIEVEIFVHGAMCMAYSGHCTWSNYTAGRDSNRGGCIQSCRHRYQIQPQNKVTTPDNPNSNLAETTWFSSKDLNAIALLPEILAANIDSIKIEGRMKSQLYLANTLRAYRQVINRIKAQQPLDLSFWQKELVKMPHRNYCQGSLSTKANQQATYWQDNIQDQFLLAGVVVDTQNQQFCMLSMNSIPKQAKLECLNPNGQNWPVRLVDLSDVLHNSVERTQPSALFWLQTESAEHGAVQPGTVVRWCKEK